VADVGDAGFFEVGHDDSCKAFGAALGDGAAPVKTSIITKARAVRPGGAMPGHTNGTFHSQAYALP